VSSGGGELDLDAVPIPGGSRYNLARAREKEYLAGPRGWAEARTNSERASTQPLSGKAYSQR